MSLRIFMSLTMLVTLIACGAQPSGSNPVSSTAVAVGTLQITDVWARSALVMGGDMGTTAPTMDMAKPTEPAMAMEMSGAISGAYMTITNSGNSADRLLKVQGDVAASLELHTMTDTNGVMQMRPVESIEIPANGEVQLKPGSFHVMLIGLKQGLKAGDSIPLTLQFEKAGTVRVTAIVRDAK